MTEGPTRGASALKSIPTIIAAGALITVLILWLTGRQEAAVIALFVGLLALVFTPVSSTARNRNRRSTVPLRRHSIPLSVTNHVWRRDSGRCVECGAQGRLEFHHIVPLAEGGESTASNIQLLCADCVRKKGDSPQTPSES